MRGVCRQSAVQRAFCTQFCLFACVLLLTCPLGREACASGASILHWVSCAFSLNLGPCRSDGAPCTLLRAALRSQLHHWLVLRLRRLVRQLGGDPAKCAAYYLAEQAAGSEEGAGASNSSSGGLPGTEAAELLQRVERMVLQGERMFSWTGRKRLAEEGAFRVSAPSWPSGQAVGPLLLSSQGVHLAETVWLLQKAAACRPNSRPKTPAYLSALPKPFWQPLEPGELEAAWPSTRRLRAVDDSQLGDKARAALGCAPGAKQRKKARLKE